MSARILVVNAFWSLLNHLFARGSLIVGSIVLARSLATPEFAAYSYFQLTISMLAAYASMGLGVTASRYFAEVGSNRLSDRFPPLGMLYLLSISIAAVVFILIMVVPEKWINAGLNIPQWLLAAGVACTALGVVPGGAILGLERYREATIIAVITGVGTLFAAWWAARHQAPFVAMWSIVLAALFQAAGQFAISLHVVGVRQMRIQEGMYLRDLSRVFEFAGPMLLVSLMAASGSWLVGRIVLHLGGGELEFSLYSIGLQWFGLALVIPGMISRVILPMLVKTSGESTIADSRKMVREGAILAVFAATSVALIGAMLGPWLMPLYGGRYSADRWFIAAFMGAAILSAPANTLGNAIVARDGQKYWLAATAMWLIALGLLAFATAADMGAWSGALAQAVGALVLASLGFVIARKKRLV